MSGFEEARDGYSIKSLGLTNNEGELKWIDAQFGDGYCIVKSLDGDIGEDDEEMILDFLSKSDTAVTKQFLSIKTSLMVRLLTYNDCLNTRISVDKGWTYTVYVYQKTETDILVYRPLAFSGMNAARRTVGFEFSARSEKVMITKKGFLGFKQKEEDSGFYKVDVSGNKDLLKFAEQIYYEIGEYKIPLTKAVLEQGYFYLKSDKAPEFKSRISSISIV